MTASFLYEHDTSFCGPKSSASIVANFFDKVNGGKDFLNFSFAAPRRQAPRDAHFANTKKR